MTAVLATRARYSESGVGPGFTERIQAEEDAGDGTEPSVIKKKEKEVEEK